MGPETGPGFEPMEIARRLALSERLRRRRFELLPLRGPGAVFADVQGRAPGQATAPASLVELISSIATVGVLQPILVEEVSDDGLRLVAGERRVRAAQWGASHHPDNPHFAAIPAVVCPGPLSEEERRVWQLVENLAREDLQPAELAAALLFERSAVLAAKLLSAGVALPADVAYLDDPAARFRALDRLRVQAGCHHLGAPWEEVLRRLGLQLREEKAKALVRAFAALPPELSAEMDAAKVALATRLEFLKLNRGRAQAAAALWEAVKARQHTGLLAAAVREQMAQPDLDPVQAVDAAEALHAAADRARASAARRAAHGPEPGPARVPPEHVDDALGSLKKLLGLLRGGAELGPYDAGSLRLAASELLERLGSQPRAAVA